LLEEVSMKRLCGLMVLMLVSSSADAGTISFSVGGHRIRIEAPRGCSSSSCASISIPGVYESRKKRDDDKRDIVASPPPAPAPAQAAPPPAPAPVQQSTPPAPKAVVATVPAPAPLAAYRPAAVATQEVAPPPPMPQVQPATIVTQDCTTPPAAKPDETRPAPATSSPLLKVLHEEDATDSPLGDWQTEGRGMVRIAECGRALCGYAIREGEDEKGEAILINMKPKSDQQWSGSVYSKDSGDTYYGTMRMKGPNMLRVEACAFSRFYCNGGNWTRITTKPMVTSRQVTQEPRT
jgi:Uncharacterized protein conserved in bacteria (DUF2147)